MNGQNESWGDLAGRHQRVGLVGQVYFRRDERRLDAQDERAVRNLANQIKHLLRDRRIELAFEGFADYRGASGYNMRLGQHRVTAVVDLLERIVGDHPNYSSWTVISRGEQQAAQGSPSVERMAEDRRVDIYSTYMIGRETVLPEVRMATSLVRRIVYRKFIKLDRDQSNWGSRGTDTTDEGISALINLLNDVATSTNRFERHAGQERVSERQVREVIATYRVNIVHLEVVKHFRRIAGGDLRTWSTQVRYDWGPPVNRVTINLRVIGDIYGEHSDFRETTHMSRSQAERSSLLYPPNP